MSTRAHSATTSSSTREALDTLAHQLSGAGQDELVRHVVGDLVAELEHLAQASLGPTADDPTVVLLRRFARAHRRLLAQPDLEIDEARLAGYGRAVRDPADALLASCHARADAAA